MFSNEITFEKLPQAVEYLISKVEKLETLLNTQKSEQTETDKWFNLQELCGYHPDRPARQTVYGWVGARAIPYHKKGKKLQFLKSEIDAWLKADKHKSMAELQAEAEQFVNSKRGGLR